jgi:uncharacterized protein YrrD
MLMKASQVIGLPVMAVDTGKKMEKVSDVVYDPSQQKIQALIIDDGGIFSHGKAIPIQNVRNIGHDAIVIESADKIEDFEQLDEDVRHIAEEDKFLTKSVVMTESGEKLGEVSDLLFSPETGSVEELIVSQGSIADIKSGQKHLKPSEIITIGEDALIVSSHTKAEFDQQADEAGVQGAVSNAKEEAAATAQNAKETWQSPDTQSKLEEFRQDAANAVSEGKEQLQQAADKAKQKIEDARSDPTNQQGVDDATSKVEEMAGAVQHKAAGARDDAASRADQIRQGMERDHENHVVGQYLTRNIMGKNDELLAVRGDIVTHELLDEAKAQGLEDLILGNVTKDPLDLT